MFPVVVALHCAVLRLYRVRVSQQRDPQCQQRREDECLSKFPRHATSPKKWALQGPLSRTTPVTRFRFAQEI